MSDRLEQIDWSKWDSKEDNFAKYRHVKSKLIYGKLPEQKPDVSIMIPTFRRADLLKEAIDSALGQKTRYSFTITVVDNAADIDQATDDLMQEYCTEYENIIYYRNAENIGMFGNWNRCIELAQADWMCMLHDDDMLMDNYINNIFPIAKKRKYGIICCRPIVVDEREERNTKIGFGFFTSLLEKAFIIVRSIKEIPITEHDLIRGTPVASPSHLLCTEYARMCGGYCEKYFPIADIVFYQKVMKYFGMAYVTRKFWIYRICKNDSLKIKTVYSTLKNSGEWFAYILKQCGKSETQCRKGYWIRIIELYHTMLDYKSKVPFNDIKKRFEIPNLYSNIIIRILISTRYILQWGILLFRVP